MPRLTAIFGGLIAFVPLDHGGTKGMRVLMPKLRAPSEVLSGDRCGPLLAAHFPLLRFNEKYFHLDSPRKPDWAVREGESESEDLEYLFLLGNERLSLDTKHLPPDLFEIIEDPSPSHPDGPNRNEQDDAVYERQRTDFRWVPRMTLAHAQAGSVDKSIANPSSSNDVTLVADFFEGRMRTHKLAGEGPRDYSEFEFPELPDDKTRPIAEEVSLVTTCGPAVEIKSASLDTGNAGKSIYVDAQSGDPVIHLEHLELEGMFRPVVDGRGDTAEDFLAYYELAERRPHRRQRRPPILTYSGGGGAGPRICPTVRFEELSL